MADIAQAQGGGVASALRRRRFTLFSAMKEIAYVPIHSTPSQT
jgi:hypothetical protein